MTPRQVAQALAVGRIAIGAAHVFAPRLSAAQWVGSDADKGGTQVFATAFGARDLALGAGVLAALHMGQSTKTWMRAGILADVADLAATMRNRDGLPTTAVAGVGAMASTATVLGIWLQAALD